MNEDLPDGWIRSALPEAFVVNPRKPPADSLAGDFKVTFVPMGAVDAAAGAIVTPEIRQIEAVRKGYTAFAEGDVILAKITPCFENGKIAVARGLINGTGFGSTEFHVFRSRGSVLPEFLFHYLRQPCFREEAAGHMTGTAGQARVPTAYLEALTLPVPPLPEQARIVARLKTLLDQVNSTKDRLRRVSQVLKRFRRSILAAACSGRLTEDFRARHNDGESGAALLLRIRDRRLKLGLPSARRQVEDEGIDMPEDELPEGWVWTRVGHIADVRLGGTPSRKESSYWKGSVPWVSSGEVANCRISGTAESLTKKGLENSNAKLYPAGTVLIAMIGEGKTRGQSAILDIEACTNQNVAGLVSDTGLMNDQYVWYWALSEYENNRGEGRGGNQAALNGAKVRALPFPLPPVAEQAEIVRIAGSLLRLADAVEERLAHAAQITEDAPAAILAKAFSGELVASDAEATRLKEIEVYVQPQGQRWVGKPSKRRTASAMPSAE